MDKLKLFLEKIGRPARVSLLARPGADSACAATILRETLSRLGFLSVEILFPPKGETLYSPATRRELGLKKPEALIILSGESENEAGFPVFPLLPPGGEEDAASFSEQIFEVCSGLAQITDLAWIAATGARKRSSKLFGEIHELLECAFRASAFDPPAALHYLEETRELEEMLCPKTEAGKLLIHYRDEVRHELAVFSRLSPEFSGKVGLIAFRSPCDIGGLLTNRWFSNREGVILAANEGWVPGRVMLDLCTRSRHKTFQLLRSLSPGSIRESFDFTGKGRARGWMELSSWRKKIRELGFEAA